MTHRQANMHQTLNHLHKHLHEVSHDSLKRCSSLVSIVSEGGCVWKMYVVHAFMQMGMPSTVSFVFTQKVLNGL